MCIVVRAMHEQVVNGNRTSVKYKMFDLFFVYAYYRSTYPSDDVTNVDDILNSFMFLFGTSRDTTRNYLNALLSSEGYFYIKEYDALDVTHGRLVIKPDKAEAAKKAYDLLMPDKNFVEFMERSVSRLARRTDIAI